jgi:hypothetical protein
MFAYRRKKSLDCEQLEGRFAPSSVLVGSSSRSTLRDAQAVDSTQAEQAAFFLAASAVMRQSSSVTNVAPITFDQTATGEVDAAIVPTVTPTGSDATPRPGFTPVEVSLYGMCMMPDGSIQCREVGRYTMWVMEMQDKDDSPQPTGDGTASGGQLADDFRGSTDIPSSNADCTNNTSPPSTDAAPVVVEPVDQQPVGVDDPIAVDPQPVSDSSLVTGDNVTDLTSVDNCPPITDASGGAEVDAVPAEPQSDDAERQGASELSFGADCMSIDYATAVGDG